MSITTAVCDGYIRDSINGLHTVGDTFKLALIRPGAAGTLGQATENYRDLGPDELPAALGYLRGGALVHGPTPFKAAGQWFARFTDAVWPLASFQAAGGLLYNESKGGAAVMVLAFGGVYTGNGGTFMVPLRAPFCAESLLA